MTTTTAKYIGVPIRNHAGVAQIGATINVTIHSSGLPATLTDDDGDPLANPLTTDGEGRYEFNVADGVYDLTVYTSAETYVIEKVVISAFESSSAALDALGALTPAADKVPYFTSASAAALATLTAFGRSVIACVDAAAARTVLGLGSMALQAAGAVAITGGTMAAVAITGGSIDNTPIGATTPNTVKATTLESTIATGTAPLTVASTTKVTNLNSDTLDGTDWRAPGAIGGVTPGSGAFTTISATGTITTGLTATGVAFYGAAGVLSYDAGLTYDSANDYLLVNHNAAAPQAAISGTLIHAAGIDAAANVRILVDSYGTGTGSFAARNAAGTAASPTATQSGATLGQFVGFGYGTTGYSAASRAGIQLQTSEVWTDSAQGTRILFNVTVPTTTTSSTALTLSSTGSTQLCADAATNSATTIASFQHTTTGTAAAGFGSLIQVQGYDDGGTTRVMSQQTTTWTDAASATRSSKLNLSIIVNASAVVALSLTPAAAVYIATDAATNSASTIFTFQHATSGTVANGFGSLIQVQGPDDGATMRGMGNITVTWTTAATATRTSKWAFNVVNNAALTTAMTLLGTGVTFQTGFPVTISDTTASTTTAGALLIGTGTAATSVTFGGGNANIGGTLNTGGAITAVGTISSSGGRFNNTAGVTSGAGTGACSWWRSGGTYLGTSAGDMVFQTDLANARSYVFTAGATTPAIVLTIGPTGNVTFIAGGNVVLDATTGSKIGTATTQKLGFWNSAPVVQPAATTAAGAAVVTTGSALASYGYTQAQADDIVAQLNKTTARVNDMYTKFQTIGIIA